MENPTKKLGTKLLFWGIPNIILGFFLYLAYLSFDEPLAAGIGIQAMAWGTINTAIALFSIFRRNPIAENKLAKSLKINSFLDLIYMAVGVILIFIPLLDDFTLQRGHGTGLLIQGTGLLIFDLYHWNKMKGHP